MSDEYFPDCLVLKIVEHDSTMDTLDTSLYVIYDKVRSRYIVRGKRSDENRKGNSCTFSFNCEFAHELYDFITFVITPANMWSYVLYNYDNLPYDTNEISYEFLEEYESCDYELGGYEKLVFDKSYLLKNLRMLRNVFNYY